MAYDVIIGRGDDDIKKLGNKGLIFLGKQYVKMGQFSSLSNKIMLDVNTSHIILISGKRGCLAGDTKVFTDKGYKDIKEFDEKKDKIYSFDKEEKKFEVEKAKLIKYDIDEELIIIKLKNGQELIATFEHPFLVKSNWIYSWKIASEINTKDEIVGILKLSEIKPSKKNLCFEKINKISKKKIKTEVYDLRIPKNHSFIANGIISHNSGKSYGMSVMAEEMSHLPEEVSKNLSILIMDTMGIFWSMKYPNTKQEDELREWGMKPKGLDVKVYTPLGKFKEYKDKGIPTDFSFSIRPNELSANDWVNVFSLKVTEPVGVLIERIISDLIGNYELDDIIKLIQKDKKSNQEIRNAAENRFEAAKSWGIFSKQASEIRDIVKGGQISILDTSCYDDFNIKALVTGILSKKLLQERMVERKKEEMSRIQSGQHFLVKEKQDFPMVWIFVDECHEMLPKNEKTPATDALVQILREGRQPGISLVLATQQPGEIHKDVLTQSDIIISYRLTAKSDIEALNAIMQTYLTSDILTYINNLPDIKGSGIILDDTSERIYSFKTRPKLSWHGGDAPTAVKVKKKFLDLNL